MTHVIIYNIMQMKESKSVAAAFESEYVPVWWFSVGFLCPGGGDRRRRLTLEKGVDSQIKNLCRIYHAFTL